MKFAPRTHGEAALAIEAAIANLRFRATAEQIADLADALDAFKQNEYGVAIALAKAVLKSVPQAKDSLRPTSMARTLDDIEDEFREKSRFAFGARCPIFVPGREIYATARLMILQHGPWAGIRAATRTDAFFAQGDRRSAAVWLRIFNAIGVLGGDNPRDNESVI
ncbi:MAG: hypothetical protein ACREIP_17595 [Alphaproteobacteria bacterium]